MRRFTSAVLLLLLAAGPAFAQEKFSRADAVLDGLVRDGKIAGGLLVIAKDGEVVHLRTAGYRDREAGHPVRPDTILRLYSMTKAIVSAAALLLVDEGKVGLDDPVARHVPELADVKVWTKEGLRAPARPPTVKDLLLHTSGYTYGGGPPDVAKAYGEKKPLAAKDLDDFAARLKEIPLAFDPGTGWVYGLSTDILGVVVQRASKTPLDRFLAERIFKPLDMKDTGFHVPAEKADRLATNYTRGKDGLKVLDAAKGSKYLSPPTFCSGGGGLVGTAGDYVRFLLMVEGGGALGGVRLLKAETAALMTANQLPPQAFPIRFGDQVRHGTGFGLGFSVRTADTAWDPQARVGEYGWGGAASTHYWVSPKDRLVVVTMEQTMPYTFDTEFAVKGLIYEAAGR